ncbi:hypothetical protein BV898_15250 [Hypsibius exemplaris]|uniref:Uncharacterized protein n=1 Tax=Hypsibius exemplaris TaxID=2072580 RepID=A0A9X6NCA1_HYPEX|nr:hypothetical protein BV898_15250 [Hypsibius exemplaris]
MIQNGFANTMKIIGVITTGTFIASQLYKDEHAGYRSQGFGKPLLGPDGREWHETDEPYGDWRELTKPFRALAGPMDGPIMPVLRGEMSLQEYVFRGPRLEKPTPKEVP